MDRPVPPAGDSQPSPASIKKRRGGRLKWKAFLRLVQSGTVATKEEAFVRAGYPVKGVTVPADAQGWLPEQVSERAAQILESDRAKRYLKHLAEAPKAPFDAGIDAKSCKDVA